MIKTAVGVIVNWYVGSIIRGSRKKMLDTCLQEEPVRKWDGESGSRFLRGESEEAAAWQRRTGAHSCFEERKKKGAVIRAASVSNTTSTLPVFFHTLKPESWTLSQSISRLIRDPRSFLRIISRVWGKEPNLILEQFHWDIWYLLPLGHLEKEKK